MPTIRQQPPAPPQPQPWSALQKAATDLGATPDHLVHIDGVRWDIENLPSGEAIEKGVFSDAYVNPAKLKDVYLLIKPFIDQPRNLPGHALLNFEFQPDAPVTNSQGQKNPGLALSIEAHFHQGEKYDPNIKNPVIYQMGTWSDALEKANVYDHDPLHRYKLNLTQEQKETLLMERIHASTQNHDTDMYDSVNNSCLSNLIDSINKVVPEHQRIPRQLPDGSPDPSATVPVWCPNVFAAHGLLGQPKPDIFPEVPKPPQPAPPPAILQG